MRLEPPYKIFILCERFLFWACRSALVCINFADCCACVCICVCAERQAFRWNQVNCAVDGDPFKENFKKNWVEMPNKCYQRSKQLFVLYMLKKRCFFSPALKTQDGFSKWTAIIWQGNYSENSIFSAQFLSFYLFLFFDLNYFSAYNISAAYTDIHTHTSCWWNAVALLS